MAIFLNKNKRYSWRGFDKTGLTIKGNIRAASLSDAKLVLQKQGIIIQHVAEHYLFIETLFQKINLMDITVLSRQLAVMVAADIPLIQSLQIIQQGHSKKRIKELIAVIRHDIEIGHTLAEALGKHPSLFNNLFCSLIKAGEQSGSLSLMLDRVANYQEKLTALGRKISKVLAYPILVLLIAVLVTIGLLIFVIPQFASIFNTFGSELPFLTRSVIGLSNYLQNHYCLWVGACSFLGLGFLQAKRHITRFSYHLDKTLLALPLIGTIIQKNIIAHFSRTLAITLSASLPLIQSLEFALCVTQNKVFQLAKPSIITSITNGQSIYLSLQNSQLFPAMVIQMVTIGEEAGKLEHMLNKIADYYEEEINNTIESLNILLEPLIMSILGIVVGFLLLAMYVPIFKLGSVM